MWPDTNHASEANAQARLWTYERIIKRYLRYTMIRCTCFTNDKPGAQRIAFYALIAACLLGDELQQNGEVRHTIDMMVDLVGNETLPSRCVEVPVFGLDDRMCEVAGALNAIPGPLREVLILHHIERLDGAALADALELSPAEVAQMLAEAETEFAALLTRLSSQYGGEAFDVHALLVDFAGCLDLPWAEDVGGAVLQYLTAWDDPDERAVTPWTVN